MLLLLIALASAVGTGIPQGDPPASYLEAYGESPWLGLLNGEQVLQLQLDHVYSSGWFLALLGLAGAGPDPLQLATAMAGACRPHAAGSITEPPRQLSKLAIAESQILPGPQPAALDAVAKRC